jgi:hypothetical protein
MWKATGRRTVAQGQTWAKRKDPTSKIIEAKRI